MPWAPATFPWNCQNPIWRRLEDGIPHPGASFLPIVQARHLSAVSERVMVTQPCSPALPRISNRKRKILGRPVWSMAGLR